jgi:phospholipid/cholesterol/gamma-HCH transport system substrate-binding protein
MLALSAVLVGLIFYVVGSNQKLFDAKYSIYMFKPNAESLIPGAFITLSGLKVGVVGKMELTEHENQQGVLIELKIDKDYRNYITSSSVAQIKTMGVLGDKYVDITIGRSTEAALETNALIQSSPSINMDEVMTDAAGSVVQLKRVLTNLNTITQNILSGNGTIGRLVQDSGMANDLSNTLRNAQNISLALNNGKGSAGRFLRDTTLYHSLTNISKQFEMISEQIAQGKGTLGKAIADSGLFVRLKSAVSQADTLMNKLNGDGTLGRLINDKEYYKELIRLTKDLRILTEDIKQHPEKYGSFSLF